MARHPLWFPAGRHDAKHSCLSSERAVAAGKWIPMGRTRLVVCGAGGWVSGVSRILATFARTADLVWRTDNCTVFLGYGRVASIWLCRESSHWRMVAVICDATRLGC